RRRAEGSGRRRGRASGFGARNGRGVLRQPRCVRRRRRRFRGGRSADRRPRRGPVPGMSKGTRHVVISDERHQLPYSKGLMASSIMATGLAPARAFHVAEVIEQRLDEGGRASISQSDLTELALTVLRE